MASSFLTSVSGLASVFITNYVNTGNRNMDTAIISILIIVVGSVLNSLQKVTAQIRFRNRIRSWWYRPKSFTDFNDQQYEMYAYSELREMKTASGNALHFIDMKIPRSVYTKIMPRLVGAKHALISKKSASLGDIGYDRYYPFGIHKGSIVYLGIDDYSATHWQLTLLSDGTEALIRGNKFIDDLMTAQKPAKNTAIEIHTAELQKDGTKLTFEDGGFINPKRTFDTLYYDQKQELYELLLKFKEERMYPEKLSLDNKIGILLHGPPGTGKTGTISAIANMLERPVLNVNLAEVILAGKVKELFNATNYKKYVIVLDEVDHMMKLCTDTLTREKDAGPPPQPKQDWTSLLAVAEGEERQKILEMIKDSMKKEKSKHQFDFATFLQLMDGLEDATGRVLIFCTNNPRVLETTYPALFRPGRIDIKLCLGHCSTQMFEDILAASLSLDDTGRERVRNANLPLHTWTPLQVINTALLCKTLEPTLAALRRGPPVAAV